MRWVFANAFTAFALPSPQSGAPDGWPVMRPSIDFEARAEHVVDAEKARGRFDLERRRGRGEDQRVALGAVRFQAAAHFGEDAVGDARFEEAVALLHQVVFVAAGPVRGREGDQVLEAREAERAARGECGEAQAVRAR